MNYLAEDSRSFIMCVNFDTARMAIMFLIIVFANKFKAVKHECLAIIPVQQPTAVNYHSHVKA